MSDHSQCQETETTLNGSAAIQHDCGVCPHGLMRGGVYTLHGDAKMDAIQRQFKLRAIDQADCDSVYHARALGCAPMSLLSEATLLLKKQPAGSDGVCIHCERVIKLAGHAMDCAWWLPHSRILDVIEKLGPLAEAIVWKADLQ